MNVSAPGKLILLGDYAVLDGGIAIVAAVNRRAKGELVAAQGAPKYSSVVQAAINSARRKGFTVEEKIEIDTSTFLDASGQKLGLGSSAAAAVVAAALASGQGDETALRLALDAHRDASNGEGSGVDVAASFYGGVIATRKQPSAVVPLASRVKNLKMSVLYTGKAASTSALVSACRASPAWNEYLAVMKPLAEEGVRTWEQQSVGGFLSVVQRYGRAMAAFGRAAGVEIVTDVLAEIMKLADEAGGAAKPSGAGGGDVAVLWTLDEESPKKIAEKTGTTLLDLAIDPRGLSRK